VTDPAEPGSAPLALRHAFESDHAAIAAVIDEWFGGRRIAHLAGRSWFRHVGSTSWLATDDAGRPVGLLLGFRSPDHPDEAVVHLLAVDPNRRRQGLGRRLVETFAADLAARGATEIVALAWPGDPPAVVFFRAVGFRAEDGPGSQNLFGTPAFADFEAPGDDRIVFRRGLVPGSPAR
jgi:ribosomal protein S18 acetylase RimI-like enzyme